MKLRSKISSMKEKRRRKNLGRKDSLYPIDVPLHLSQIDLGEELTRVPSLTSLQEAEQTEQTGQPLSRVPSLTSLFSDFNFDCEHEQEVQTDESTEAEQTEQTGQPLSRVPSLTSLFSDFNFDCEHGQEAQANESTEAEQTEQTGQPLSRVPSLTSLFSDFNFDCEHGQETQANESTEAEQTEQTGQPLSRVPSLTSLSQVSTLIVSTNKKHRQMSQQRWQQLKKLLSPPVRKCSGLLTQEEMSSWWS